MTDYDLPQRPDEAADLDAITMQHSDFARDAVHLAAEQAYLLGQRHERARWMRTADGAR